MITIPEMVALVVVVGWCAFGLGLCARARRNVQLPPLEIGPEGLPCLCGHQFNKHDQRGDMECIDLGCCCQAFILKRSAAR